MFARLWRRPRRRLDAYIDAKQNPGSYKMLSKNEGDARETGARRHGACKNVARPPTIGSAALPPGRVCQSLGGHLLTGS